MCNCLQALFHCDAIVHTYMESCTMHEEYSPLFCSANTFLKTFKFLIDFFGGHGVV